MSWSPGYEHLQSFLCLVALYYCLTASPENGTAVDENAEHVIKVVSTQDFTYYWDWDGGS